MGRTSALRFTAGSALSPMHPPGSAFSPMTTPGSSHSPMPHGRGVPPSELATALRRSRSGIFRQGDEALLRHQLTTAPKDARHRWEPQVRIDIAIASLISTMTFTYSSTTAAWWHVPLPDATGNVATPATNLVTVTPPSDTTMRDVQLPQVHMAANDRDDRMPEILTQADGLWPFWTSVTNIDSALAPATVELMEALLAATHLIVMRMKHTLNVPRPADLSSTLCPIIPTPGHGSFPSGHSTVSFMFAGLMYRLLNLGSRSTSTHDYLRRLAHRIAQNRVVAGVHFPIDSVAGRLLGETLAEYFYARCTGQSALYAGARFENADVVPDYNLGNEQATLDSPPCTAASSGTAVSRDDVLGLMWDDALAELKLLGVL